jgi:hypothetical protein
MDAPVRESSGAGTAGDADTLVAEAMEARGYPVGNFEQNITDPAQQRSHER